MLENQVTITRNQAAICQALPDYLKILAEGFTPSPEWPKISPEHLPALTATIRSLESVPVRSSPELRNQLGALLAGVFASQKIYNTPMDREALTARKRLFVEILGDYPIDAIDRAFIAYCADHDDIPAPANIKKIVDSDMALLRARRMIRRMQKMKEIAERNQSINGGSHA